MRNHKSNSQLKVDGQMTPNDADRAGLIQSLALLVFAVASVVLAVGVLIFALK